MSNAYRDENNRPTIIAASNADGQTIVPVKADPTTHKLAVNMMPGGANNGNNLNNAMLDENSVPVWTALSSADGISLVEVYADPVTGKLLIDNT